MNPKIIKLYALLALLLTFNFSVNAQSGIQNLIRGEKGLSIVSAQLSTDQQVPFVHSQINQLLGLDKNSELNLMRTETDQLGQVHFRYYQTYKGIPVENSMY